MIPKGNSPPSACFLGWGGGSLWVLPPPLSLWSCHRRTSPTQTALWVRGRAGEDHPRHCHCSPTGPICPSGHGPHLDAFHAVLRGLGRHTLDLWPEPLPAEGHSHVPTLLDLRSRQHTPVQVVGQPCVSVSAWSPQTRLLQGPP